MRSSKLILSNVSTPLKGSINKKILFKILFFSSILTLVFTVYRLYQDYKIDESFVYSYLNNIAVLTQPSLVKSMWTFDDSSAEILIDSIERSKQISYVEVLNRDKSLYYSAGNKANAELSKPDHAVRLEVRDEKAGESELIGYLNLYADFSSINDSLKSRFVFTLYTQFFKTFCVSFFVLFLIHRLISRHLISLSKAFSRLGGAYYSGDSEKNQPLTLDRNEEDDEIQSLLKSINDYQKIIYNKNHQLRNEIIAKELAEKTAESQVELIYSLFDAIELSVIIIDQDLIVKKANSIALEHSGLSLDQMNRQKITSIINFKPEKGNAILEKDVQEIFKPKSKKSYLGICRYIHEEKFPARITVTPLSSTTQENNFDYAIMIENKNDKERLAEINYHATHDFLTGLLNRYQLDNELSLILENKPLSRPYIIGFIDLDRFKSINDLFGHLKGDEVLIKVGQLLSECLGEEALIARQGGDEFVFVVSNTLEGLRKNIGDFLECLQNERFYFNEQQFNVTASIGLAFLESTDTVSSAISKADEAVYQSKNAGGNCINIFGYKGNAKSLSSKTEDYETINSVSKQLKDIDSIILYSQLLQPLQEGSNPMREEILVRVRNDDGILLLPDQFIPALERSRMTHLVDRIVIEKVCDYLSQKALGCALHLNINLSPTSLMNWAIHQEIIKLLQDAQKHGVSICFELTENTLYEANSNIISMIKAIKSHQGLIAIDDFGKGYASYSHFNNFKVDMIKIDGSLIKKIDHDSKALAIVSSIYSIADSISAITVAEHVENEQQRSLLKEMGIDYVQSYQEAMPKPL